jgi:hypothetical protein
VEARVNRLTKEIGLVLISSSLLLQGCYGQQGPRRYEFPKEGERLQAEKEDPEENAEGGADFDEPARPAGTSGGATNSGASTSHSPVHHGGHVPIFIPLGGLRGASPGPSTSSGFRAGTTTSSSSRGTTGSSIGGSSRGGFGSTGHGVAS